MTGQSRSAQEVQITLRSEQGATRPATATLTRYERGERMGRAAGFAALGLLGAGIFVFVPAVHLITTWLLPLAGLIAARSAWRTEAKLTDARGECPACGAKITLSGGSAHRGALVGRLHGLQQAVVDGGDSSGHQPHRSALNLRLEARMQAKIVNSDTPLPEELRLALNLRPGQAYAVIPRGKSVVLVPVPTLEEIAGIAEGADTEGYRDRRP
jgi:hypothetical protein